MNNLTVLICDDNIAVHKSISAYLQETRIKSISAFSGEEALKIIQGVKVDFIILDLMLPGKSGTEVLKEIRKFSDIPVMCLSAKSSEFDRIVNLELGADDYVTKPFSPREIITRIQVILRRTNQSSGPKETVFSNLIIDEKSYTVYINDNQIDLTPKEFKLLSLLAANPETVLSRERILSTIWDQNFYSDSRIIDAAIKRLRKKLPPEANFEIRSIYGIGYKMVNK